MSLGALSAKDAGRLANLAPGLEAGVKVMWADHGDAVSNQYAGTGERRALQHFFRMQYVL